MPGRQLCFASIAEIATIGRRGRTNVLRAVSMTGSDGRLDWTLAAANERMLLSEGAFESKCFVNVMFLRTMPCSALASIAQDDSIVGC